MFILVLYCAKLFLGYTQESCSMPDTANPILGDEDEQNKRSYAA